MHNQPKLFPQRGSRMFADGRGVRPQVPGTVARSQSSVDAYFHTGMAGGSEGDGMPVPVTPELLARGQERFNIYCSPCHSRTGYGQGMIVQRGYYPAANMHSERLRQAPLGHFFSVITNGYGAMPDYAAELPASDRWAVVAYIRALQLSQDSKLSDLSQGAHPQPLDQIAVEQGLPSSFADSSLWQSRSAARQTRIATSQASVPATPLGMRMQQNTTTIPPPTAAAYADVDTPETASDAKVKPIAADAAAGAAIYENKCSMCHQSHLEGKPGKFPALIGVVDQTGEKHVREMIVNGAPDAHPMMPAYGDQLTDPEIANLIAFLRHAKAAP